MNKIDFTFTAGSSVYVPERNWITDIGGTHYVRIWRLGSVISAYGIKTAPEDDFMYLVLIGSGDIRWFNLEDIKDARLCYQPPVEYLDNDTKA